MNNEIIFYTDLNEISLIEQSLSNFNIKKFKVDEFKKTNHKNKNILFFLKDLSLLNYIKKSSLNNSVLCLIGDSRFEQNSYGSMFLLAPISVNKLKDYADKFFIKNILEYSDITIIDKKITNNKNKKFIYFTDLEHKIFVELLKYKKLNKNYFKENILNIKNDINTYSIESHFSRIRKKLSVIDSSIIINSKEENFFIN